MRLFTLAGWLGSSVFYRTIHIDGLSIFYREAGRKDAPTILLLHGVPSSSRMFQPLLTRLADNYRLVAPDYPGYGHSDWPDPKQRIQRCRWSETLPSHLGIVPFCLAMPPM
jgi:pimeloyl-ACP methyl ester carboxylesterase